MAVVSDFSALHIYVWHPGRAGVIAHEEWRTGMGADGRKRRIQVKRQGILAAEGSAVAFGTF